MIWSAAGLIVTNAHVTSSEQLHVELADGRRLEARLIARDSRRDLALLKVNAAGLIALERCDLSSLRAGEAVLALGYPMGGDAVTVGILQAAPREGHWLTADIRVAPGNSGGALCDVHGRLVGINTHGCRRPDAGDLRGRDREICGAAPRPGRTSRCCMTQP